MCSCVNLICRGVDVSAAKSLMFSALITGFDLFKYMLPNNFDAVNNTEIDFCDEVPWDDTTCRDTRRDEISRHDV